MISQVWRSLDPAISLESQEILEPDQLGVYDGRFVVACIPDETRGGYRLERAHGSSARDSAILPSPGQFDVYDFPPDLDCPAVFGTYDSSRLDRPYATTCSCVSGRGWCIPVYMASGERVAGGQVQHDQTGNRWWLTGNIETPLFSESHNPLPGVRDAPSQAIPGTRSASRFAELVEDPNFWTFSGIAIPADGHFAFEWKKRSGRYADPGFAYLSKLYRDTLESGATSIGDDVVIVAFYAALVRICRPVLFDRRTVLEAPSEADFRVAVEEIAARLAMRRGLPQPLPCDEETRYSSDDLSFVLDGLFPDIWQGISNDKYYVDDDDCEGIRAKALNERSVRMALLLSESLPEI